MSQENNWVKLHQCIKLLVTFTLHHRTYHVFRRGDEPEEWLYYYSKLWIAVISTRGDEISQFSLIAGGKFSECSTITTAPKPTRTYIAVRHDIIFERIQASPIQTYHAISTYLQHQFWQGRQYFITKWLMESSRWQ